MNATTVAKIVTKNDGDLYGVLHAKMQEMETLYYKILSKEDRTEEEQYEGWEKEAKKRYEYLLKQTMPYEDFLLTYTQNNNFFFNKCVRFYKELNEEGLW